MARSTTRNIPQKTLAPADRAIFDAMIERIKPLVGVHIERVPGPFISDTRIHLDLMRFPVSRPQQTISAWGAYFTHSPSYATLSPDQRWSYIAWLAGDRSLGIQLFRLMRLNALCAELSGPRASEAIEALGELYEQSANDTVAATAIGNILTVVYAASDAGRLREWLQRFAPSVALSPDLQARCYALAELEAPGRLLLEMAMRCSFKLGRGMSNRRELVEAAMGEIAARRNERDGGTFVGALIADSPLLPAISHYMDTLVSWVARAMGLAQGQYAFERSAAAESLRGLAAAAQEHVRSQRKGAEPLDGLTLLDGILDGDSSSVQFDLSGTGQYAPTKAEVAALKAKLARIDGLAGVNLADDEWSVYGESGEMVPPDLDALVFRQLPIKTPNSAAPWNTPSPPTYSAAAYRTLTPEQRWWYLDWLAGEPVEPLPLFLVVRFKGVIAAWQKYTSAEKRRSIKEWISERSVELLEENLFGLIETLAEESGDETLGRVALEHLMPAYAEYGEGERATAAFNRTNLSIDQAGRMLGMLWEAGGQLLGAGLLHAAKGGGFNHTPLTRECFDQIAERAEVMLATWEADNGPLMDLPTTGSGLRRRRQLSGLHIAAEIAREAQEAIKTERRNAPRSARMSADELAAERAELAELPANAGDGPAEALYRRLTADAALVPMYLAEGVSALAGGDAPSAVAFLRRAVELDGAGAAPRLLALARRALAEWQKTKEASQP